MNNYSYKNKQKLIIFIFVTLILTSLISIIYNKGFKYAEYHYLISVELKSNKEVKNFDTFFNKLITNTNPIKINRKNNEVILEKTSIIDVHNKVDDINKDNKEINVNIKEILPIDTTKDILVNLIKSLAIILVASLFGLYYFILRHNSKITEQIFFKINLIFILSFVLSVFLQFGLISIISNIYQVQVIDLLTVPLIALTLSLLFFFFIYKLKYNINLDMSLVYNNINKLVIKYFKNILGIYFLILLILSFGFGLNFIIVGVLIFGSMIISQLTLYILSSIRII